MNPSVHSKRFDLILLTTFSWELFLLLLSASFITNLQLPFTEYLPSSRHLSISSHFLLITAIRWILLEIILLFYRLENAGSKRVICPGLCQSLMPLGLVRWSTAHSSSGRLCHSASPLLFWLNSQWNLLKLLHLGCWDYSATIWTPGSILFQGEVSFPVYFSHYLMPTSVSLCLPNTLIPFLLPSSSQPVQSSQTFPLCSEQLAHLLSAYLLVASVCSNRIKLQGRQWQLAPWTIIVQPKLQQLLLDLKQTWRVS